MVEAEQQQKQDRLVACIVNIKEVINGQYVKEEGWLPNYILTKSGMKVSRVNIIGVLVNKQEGNLQTINIDDGTGGIEIREFENSGLFKKVKIGDMVLVIGRPREYSNEKYIVGEIVKKIGNNKWVEFRKKQLELMENSKEVIGKKEEIIVNNVLRYEKKEKVVKEEEYVEVDGYQEELNVFDKIIDFIKNKDLGGGVEIEQAITSLAVNEDLINKLLEKGEIYEISPGKVKVLD